MPPRQPATTPRARKRKTPAYVPGNRVTRLGDGPSTFEAIERAITQAERQVLLEMYWFADDRVGRRIAIRLIAAAQRGVECAVIYDALGSYETSSAFFLELRAGGVAVIEFNPLRPWSRRFRWSGLMHRDHRKMLVVDGRLAITGGINLANPWLPASDAGGGWLDECVAVEGPVVAGFSTAFTRTWSSNGGPPLRCLTSPAACGHQYARVLAQASFLRRREISRSYLGQLRRARERIIIANPYFLPDGRILRALARAARRGVCVRVLVPGVSDVEIVRIASCNVWPRLMRDGVEIYEWYESFLHAKTAVVDGRWATVGTFNLDFRSIRHNLEINLAVADRDYASELESAMMEYISRARRVTSQAIAQRSWSERWLAALLYRARRLL